MGQRWSQFTDGSDFPSRFRVVVVQEGDMFSAVALEWYLVASGCTVELAVLRLEHLLFGQAVLMIDFRDRGCAPMKPAPEDYQRIATSGTHHIFSDPGWARAVGRPVPVVHRCVIDMTASRLEVVER